MSVYPGYNTPPPHAFPRYFSPLQIENLLEQLKDKDKQLAALREKVQGLQTDSSNTETALSTLEEALSEKVGERDIRGV